MDFRKVIIISAPSGGGKNTLINALIKDRTDIEHSVSTTTRSPRPGEVEGKSYYFVSPEKFQEMVSENRFLEWAPVLKNHYGTTYAEIERIHKNGRIAVLDIDVQGAMQIKKKHPEVSTVFIEPPSIEELAARLKKRGTESENQIQERLELARQELKQKHLYDRVILNDSLDQAIADLSGFIDSIVK